MMHWFALKVFYNKVFDIEKALEKEHIETYIPCEETLVIRNGIKKTVRKPMISSLMFFRATTADALKVQKMFTDKVREKIMPLVKSALDAVISERVKANLSDALNATAAKEEEHSAPVEQQPHGGIVTTQEEIDAYNIIRAVLRMVCSPEQVVMRDAKSYCAVLFDDNNRKPICRLYFNSQKKRVGLFDDEREEVIPLQNIDELFQLTDRLVATAKKYQA